MKTRLCIDTSEDFGISLPYRKHKKPCCCEAFLRAAMIYGSLPDGSMLRSENEAFLEICEFLLISSRNNETNLMVSSRGRVKGLILNDRLTSGDDPLTSLPKDRDSLFKCPACRGYFLRGAFLASGTVLDPEKGLHLEMTVQNEENAEFLSELLTSLDISPKMSERKGAQVVYFKESAKIEDFLTLIGAQSHSLKIMEQSIMRDLRNTINRQNNSDNANLSRNIEYTTKLLDVIEDLRESGSFALLPDKLKEAAELREKYPDDTLSQLAARTNGRISKSGLAHRLKKLSEYSDASDSQPK